MRCGLRCDDAFELTAAELGAVWRCALGNAITHERRRRRAAGRYPHPATDQTTAQRRHPVLRKLGPRFEDDFWIELGGLAAKRQSFRSEERRLGSEWSCRWMFQERLGHE